MKDQPDIKNRETLKMWRRLLPHLPYLGIIVLVTVGLRILPYYGLVFTKDGPMIRDPDAVYHLRRAELIANNFPSIPVFDSYINHPEGAYIIWPPLYDLSLGTVWWILDLIPRVASPVSVLVFFPVLLMTLASIVIYKIGLRFWPSRQWLACGTALVPALLPSTLLYSYLGQLDHHAAEFLFVALFIDQFSGALKYLREETSPRRIIRLGWLPGLCLGLGLLVQHGLLLLEAVIFLYLVIWFRRSNGKTWLLGSAINGMAFLVILPFGLYSHLKGVPLAHTHFGGFQPLVLLEATLLLFTVWTIISPSGQLSQRFRTLAVGIGTILTVALGAFIVKETMAGASYLVRSWSGWQAHIGESQSLLRLPLNETVTQLSTQMSWLVLLLPISWFILIRQWRNLNTTNAILLISTLIFTFMGFLQIRYLPYLSLFLGLSIAIVAEYIMKSWRRIVVVAIMPVSIVAGYLPCIKAIGAKDMVFNVFEELYPVLQWLRDNSQPTSNYLNPTKTEKYGVLAEWSLGHYIQYYGQRPALADNFGEHASDLGRLRRFFLAEDNQDAYDILDKYRVRFVLCRGLFWTFQSLLLDDSGEGYIAGKSPTEESASQVVFSLRIFPTVLYRLIWRYGSAVFDQQGTYYPPLERLRLVAESKGRDDEIISGPEIALIKLFEYVPGARVEVSGLPPDARVALNGIVHTPHGRWFPYVQALRADSGGTLILTLPYPNEKGEGKSFVNKYTIHHSNEERFLMNITEAMIQTGETIRIHW